MTAIKEKEDSMDLIINRELCNTCDLREAKCYAKKPLCCCDCNLKCIGRYVCPIFNYSPTLKKRKARMTREKMIKNEFNKQMGLEEQT